MMKTFSIFILGYSLLSFGNAYAEPAFQVIPLGTEGGLNENNLSAYLLAVAKTDEYVSLDAGTLRFGIEAAIKNGVFKTTSSVVLKKNVKGYLISHGHLDHVAGLIINSPDDAKKNIYGLTPTLDALQKDYFTNAAWINFGDVGDEPKLGVYHYVTLEAAKEIPLEQTKMTVEAFPLSHGAPFLSTAFLIRHDQDYLLYLGDTGADSIEKSTALQTLWKRVGPLVTAQKLKAIFIEVSFPDEQPNTKLFGHLKPELFFNEMKTLESFSSVEALQKVKIVITHQKPPADAEAKTREELKARNADHLQIVYPEQGRPLQF